MNKDDDIIDITDFDLSKKKKKKLKNKILLKINYIIMIFYAIDFIIH